MSFRPALTRTDGSKTRQWQLPHVSRSVWMATRNLTVSNLSEKVRLQPHVDRASVEQLPCTSPPRFTVGGRVYVSV